mgnify:CR=1 FL=1
MICEEKNKEFKKVKRSGIFSERTICADTARFDISSVAHKIEPWDRATRSICADTLVQVHCPDTEEVINWQLQLAAAAAAESENILILSRGIQ